MRCGSKNMKMRGKDWGRENNEKEGKGEGKF